MSSEVKWMTLPCGTKLCHTQYGAKNGIPALFFHGWPCCRLHADHLAQVANELNITLHAFDRPGIGRSEHIPNRTLHSTTEVVRNILDVLEIDSPVHLIGISGGGPYAIATACLLNNRIASTTIISGAPPFAELSSKHDMILPYRVLMRLRPILDPLLSPISGLGRWICSKPYHQAPLSWLINSIAPIDRTFLLSDPQAEHTLRNVKEALVLNAPDLFTDADAYLKPWQLDYNSITHPVHFWHGTEDRNIPIRMAKHLAAQLPLAQTHFIEGEGHYTLSYRHTRAILSQLILPNP